MEESLEASAFDRRHGLAQALQFVTPTGHRFGRFRLVQAAQQRAGPTYGLGVFALLDQRVDLRPALTGEMRQAFWLVLGTGLQSGAEIAELLVAMAHPVAASRPFEVRQRILGPSLCKGQLRGPLRQQPRGLCISCRVGQIQAGPQVLQPRRLDAAFQRRALTSRGVREPHRVGAPAQEQPYVEPVRHKWLRKVVEEGRPEGGVAAQLGPRGVCLQRRCQDDRVQRSGLVQAVQP